MNNSEFEDFVVSFVTLKTYRTIEWIFLVVSLYVITSILFYITRPDHLFRSCCYRDKRIGISSRRSSRRTVAPSRGSTSQSKRRNSSHRYYRWAQRTMSGLTVIMSMLVLIHVATDLWAYSPSKATSASAQCTRHTVSGLLYLYCAFCLYSFLWVRQRAFYAHPVLKHLAKPCLIKFSWSVLITICLVTMVLSVLFFLPQISVDPPVYEISSNATTLARYSESDQLSDGLFNYAVYGLVPPECSFRYKAVYLGIHLVLTLMFLYFQVALQFLFAFPIFKQRHKHVRYMRKTTTPSNRRTDEYVLQGISPREGHARKVCFEGKTVDGNLRVPYDDRPPSGLSSSSGLGASMNSRSFCGHSEHLEEEQARCNADLKNGNEKRHTSLQERNLRDTTAVVSRKGSSASACTLNERDVSFARMKVEMDSLECAVAKVEIAGECTRRNERYAFIKREEIIRRVPVNQRRGGLPNRPEIVKSTTNCAPIRRRSARLKSYVLRCLGMSLICCVSDMAAFMVSLIEQRKINHISVVPGRGVTETLITSLAYNANILINLFCMLICYKDWKKRLFPWYYYVLKRSCVTSPCNK